MGDPLHDLEKRLECLVPHGLSDQGRKRLDDQIDELAAGVAPPATGSPWRRMAAIAAAGAMVAGISIFGGLNRRGGDPGASAAPDGAVPEMTRASGIEVVDSQWEVEDGRDGEIVLSRFNEPRRPWNYNVSVMELVLDKETGLQVRIVSERQEAVLVAVTSF